jgi:hypothetical protein
MRPTRMTKSEYDQLFPSPPPLRDTWSSFEALHDDVERELLEQSRGLAWDHTQKRWVPGHQLRFASRPVPGPGKSRLG